MFLDFFWLARHHTNRLHLQPTHWLQVQSVYDFMTKGYPTRHGLNLRPMALLLVLPEFYYHLLPRSCLLQN